MENMELDNIQLRGILSKSANLAKICAYLTFSYIGLSFVQLIIGLLSKKGVAALLVFKFSIQTVITVVIAMSLLKFSRYTTQCISTSDNTFFTLALTHLKNFFIIMGVIFIILLGLLFLSFILSILTHTLKN